MDRNGVWEWGHITKGLERGVILSARPGMLAKEVSKCNSLAEVFILLFDVAYITDTGRFV